MAGLSTAHRSRVALIAAAAALSLAEVLWMRQRDMLGRLRGQAAAEHRVRADVGIGDWDDRCAGGELDVVAAERRVLVARGVKTRRWVLAHGLTFGGLRVDVARAFGSWSGDFMVGHLRGVG
jgi:hypothetical protein